MAFRTGSVSFSRFRVVGDAPTSVDQPLLDLLGEHVLRPPSIGAPPDTLAGWVTGRHVFDTDFTYDAVGFGDRLLAAVRVDTNKVPAEIRRAHRAMAEAERAATSVTGFINRAERLDAKEEAERRCHEEVAQGLHRKSKMIPLLWDLPRRTILAPVFSDAAYAAVNDLLVTSLDLKLQPLSSGSLAWESLSERGMGRDFDDLRPSSLTAPPAGADVEGPAGAVTPEVPWAHGGPEPKDFLGNEFLVWLWWLCEVDGGLVAGSRGTIAVAMDRTLDMDCAWGITGKQSLAADGPTRLPEAAAALRHGKWPRKAGLIISDGGDQWTLSLQGDRFIVTAAQLPRPEDAETPREVIERRLDSVATLDSTLEALYEAFLRQRVDAGWNDRSERIRKWISSRGKPAVPANASLELVEA